MAYQRFAFPDKTEDELIELKQEEFGRWLRDYVSLLIALFLAIIICNERFNYLKYFYFNCAGDDREG